MVHVFKTSYLDYYTKTINENYNLTKENDTKNIKNAKEKESIKNLDREIYDIEFYLSNENINIVKQNRKSTIRCEKSEKELSDKNYKLEWEIEEYKRIIKELKEGE